MNRPDPFSERAIILALHGRDGQIARQLLHEAGFSSELASNLIGFCGELEKGAGLGIITDEAIHAADLRELSTLFENQPAWSDFPIIILTQKGGGLERNPAAVRISDVLGNVTFVERPFHPTTLISVVRAAVRSRRRQYEARSRLEILREREQRLKTALSELEVERTALSDLTHTLEERVKARTEELLREIGEREKTEERLRQAQKMEGLGQLTGGIAHDFNNLLMAVIGNLELLRKRVSDDTRAQSLIDGAMQGAERGASLTQRLLTFSRQQELHVVPVEVTTLLRGMRDLLERSLGPRIALKLSIPEDLPPANIDANQVELAVLNLAINARDAMPDGGNINISVELQSGVGRAGLSVGQYLRIRMADSGTGMDEATLKKAIEPFFTTKPVGKGTGLGLSMVHGLAVQLGGLLDLSSEVGKGTVVDLWFPVSTEPVEVANVSRPESIPDRPSTILVVDDDPLIAMSATAMLEDLGHTVIGAHSGPRALEILKAEQVIDLMMVDYAMPGMTGVELAKATHSLRPNMPVLLVTGYAELPDGEVLSLPRLDKPYHQDQLRAHIARLLGEI